MIREVDRFECEDDGGNLYTVLEFQHYTSFRSMKGTTQHLPGKREWALADGRALNPLGEDTFKIVSSDVLIRKV